MKKLSLYLVSGFVFLFVAATSVLAFTPFFNGFETDTAGWFDNGGTITRVASGTDSITSAEGAFHAKVNGAGPFTRWGGYESEFPANGFVTQVDIYLDTAVNPAVGTIKQFDYSSAISGTDGLHRRDFIFAVGTDPLVAGQWIMTVSNNSPGWPSNPARDPFVITQTGWYTFRHTFLDNGSGVLEVVMDVLDQGGNSLHSWTLSDPTDVIGTTVGGNRYGWFVTSAFPFLAIDNSEKYEIVPVLGPPVSKDECKDGGWQGFNNPEFKNQGDCVSFVTSAH